ncbi:hypothetical protein BJX63DRAFT_428224 [Aspergillus granulosus]|uniref:F-box domain-containing protein n=1 Tax=Aspergillus granulosus TaxID=176169 RepID=A0ABR4HY38_9EURO
MRGLSDLPVELLDEVLSSALVEPNNSRQLCHFALVNRAWHSRTTAQVYGSWVYNGTRHSFRRLWLFLRTILSDRYLSCLLRRVHIGNWGVNPYVLLDQEADGYALDEDDISLVRRAVNQATLTHIEPDIISAIRQGDRRPLMALLLASVPNLMVIRAHVPLHDPYLAAVLQQALDCQKRDIPGPLRQLCELYAFAEVSIPAKAAMEDISDIPGAPLRLNDIWPVFFLRPMRKVHLYDLDTDGIAALIEKNQNHQTSYINNLLLRIIDESACQPADIKALIGLPHTLLNFSLFINDQISHLWNVTSKVSNLDIWDALYKHRKNIQYLDIFRKGIQANHPLGHLKSLQAFTQLRELRSHFLVLTRVGYCDIPNNTNLLLKDTLPRSLEAFRLYESYYGFHALPAIPKQIQELVMEGLHPVLKSITLEDKVLAHSVWENGHASKPLLQSRIRFEPKDACWGMIAQPGCQISRAGGCVGSWGDMYEMRVDGNRRFFNIMQIFPEDSDGDYSIPSLPYTSKIHVLPFTDHTGDLTRPGYMVFYNYSNIPLPPLLSFAIYFTHLDTLPSTVDLQGLYRALTGFEDDLEPRLDIYILPGATEMDCLSHYRDEQLARDSCTAQIRAFQDLSSRSKLGLPSSPAPPGRLPGLLRDDPPSIDHDRIFICTEKDWRHGQQSLYWVPFHSPDLPETGGDANDDVGNGETHGTDKQEKSDRPLTITREPWSTNRHSPAYDEEQTVGQVASYIADVYYEADDELVHVWRQASYYGWTNWL